MDSDLLKRSSSPPPPLRSNDMVRAVMRVLALVVLLGYLMMWIVMPTNTYGRIWLPTIRAKLDSTYFGVQGPSFLVYTFPILFVAVLGCVYIHFGTRSSDNKLKSYGKRHPLVAWKKPMLVKAPLGIASGMELTFLIMFMILLIWSMSTYLYNGFAAITPKSAAEKGERVWQAKLYSAALILGYIGNIGLTFLFFPVARGSSLLPLFGLTSEGSIKYHIWLGHMVMVFFTAHGLGYIIYWAATNRISEMLKWAKTNFANVAGELSLLAGLAMWATTFPRIRRRMFELFFYTHYLYILFTVLFIFHVGLSYISMMLPGFYLFLIDRYLRFLQSRERVRLVSVRIFPGETLELNFCKSPGLSYNPTSILFVNVPSISKLQWHPFTITSNSSLEPNNLTAVIKSEGRWSKKLYQMLSSPSPIDHLEVSVEGPYGPASTNFLRHETLMMVSGGSGITPFISIIRELIFASTTYKSKTPQVVLICAFKNSSDLSMLDLLLPISGTPSALSRLQLKIEAYVTRETENMTDKFNPQTIWFKPHAMDAPISAILGPKNWLWLGAIISSSFIIFLTLLGLVTRYYIYAIDHNTYEIFPWPLKAFLNILVMCISIVMTASAAVLWNKKQKTREIKQIQKMEGSTPVGTSNSWLYNADKELESLPHQSLVQDTNVHYGERPDLKKLLFDCKGSSSVGVLVCGPKKMRHEVATICSSGLADNLHFESVSFNW